LVPARCAVAVGQQEDALPSVGRSHVRSSNADCGAAVALGCEGIEDSGKNSSCPADVFPEDKSGLTLADDADEVPEEATSLPVEAGALACN
jgi:hypothetical protein